MWVQLQELCKYISFIRYADLFQEHHLETIRDGERVWFGLVWFYGPIRIPVSPRVLEDFHVPDKWEKFRSNIICLLSLKTIDRQAI